MATYMQEAVLAQGGSRPMSFLEKVISANPRAFPLARSSSGKPQDYFAQLRAKDIEVGKGFGMGGGMGGGVLREPPHRNTATTSVVSPGQTQVIRPSAQVARRQGPSAETDTSLLTRQMGPEDVALGMSSLLGG